MGWIGAGRAGPAGPDGPARCVTIAAGMESTIFLVAINFVILLFSLSVHELAHAWTAERLGDPTARFLGRVSLNPLVHADPLGTIIFPIIGSLYGFMFGWAKPVPVNVGRLRHPVRDQMLVAAAGPVSNLMLAFLMFGILFAMKTMSPELGELVRTVSDGRTPRGGSIAAPLALLAFHGMTINIILAIFNLIPIAPLDGAAVLSGLLPRGLAAGLDRLQSYSMFIFVLLVISGVLQQLFNPPIVLLRSVLISS
jgi:Zn-dependent protease